MSPSASPDTATRAVGTLRPLVAEVDARGGDLEAWLQLAGLSVADLDDVDRRISVAQSNALAEAAFDITSDPALGLRVVERIGRGTADLFTYLAATCATGREAFEREGGWFHHTGYVHIGRWNQPHQPHSHYLMGIATLLTRGYGNGNFLGTIALVVPVGT